MLRRGLACLVSVSSFVFVPLASAEDSPSATPAIDSADAAEPTGAAPAAAPEDKGKDPLASEPTNPRHGLLGPVRVGVDAALGFPHPVTYGLAAMWADTVSGGLSFGNFEVKSADATIGISNWDIRGRWHPFSGSFFLGAAYGSQTIKAEINEDIEVGSSKTKTKLALEVETTYLTPHLGWFSVWDCGFVVGFDFGYQMALSSKAKDVDVDFGTGADPSGSDDFERKNELLKKATEGFGKVSIPYLTLLRMGWLL